jgi:RNA polymerase sigma factor for flagellar operon FliA
MSKSASAPELWKHYLRHRDIETRNRLIEHYRPVVQLQAARLTKKLPAQVTFDEIASAGYDGLMEAVEAYDPARKAKFETFCQRRVVGAMMDWLRSQDMQSRTVRNFEKKAARIRECLDLELSRPPTAKEIARGMGVSLDRYLQLSKLSRLGQEVHLSALQAAGEDHGRSNGRSWELRDPNGSEPCARVAREVLTNFIARGLNRDERLVLVLYYYEGLTMAEIGTVLDLSESRVSQIHKEVLERLRKRFAGLRMEMVA